MRREWDTTEYEWNHGRKPRGVGSWAFVPRDHIWIGEMPADAIAWEWGTYSDAKREVARRFPAIQEWKVLA